MERWRGRTALVTGASTGIGFAIAEALARGGMRVIACARNIGGIEELKSALNGCSNNVTAFPCDLTQEDSILNMFKEIKERFGYVDILVNNAGTLNFASISEGETASWRQMFELNVLGLTICSREALQLMYANGVDDGHIININSVAGHYISGYPATNFYTATKHMVTALTKTLNTELRQRKTKIRVTSISPGLTDTPLKHRMGAANPAFKVDKANVLQAKDVADAVMYVIACPPHVNVRELTIAHIGFSGC
ncbi:hypothetical protein RvY_16645 [Ramazzottius varieornatus]|uniref:Dehydrogenase/reductase SDR family member 11 n=1 Tax=Ramazzottius varieornatus TaxID=947166 RepID=A0A1D1VZ94_RAMVA|nr:hypothetical protein RvY_16645 [Ramazzottius varieornatus]